MGANTDPKRAASGFHAEGLRFGIVVSEFNRAITEKLLSGAVGALESAGAQKSRVEILHVPGAFEIPIAAKKLAETGRAHAIIAIGCVIRGETTHYDYIASEVSRGIQMAQMDTGVPIIFCVLTCENVKQAEARIGKGHEAGLAAMEMANLVRKLKPQTKQSPGMPPQRSGKRRRK